jgi:hypothetical protein
VVGVIKDQPNSCHVLEVYRSDEGFPLLGRRLSCFSIADHFATSHLCVSVRRFWLSLHDTFGRFFAADSARASASGPAPRVPEMQRLPGFSSGFRCLWVGGSVLASHCASMAIARSSRVTKQRVSQIAQSPISRVSEHIQRCFDAIIRNEQLHAGPSAFHSQAYANDD